MRTPPLFLPQGISNSLCRVGDTYRGNTPDLPLSQYAVLYTSGHVHQNVEVSHSATGLVTKGLLVSSGNDSW